MIFNELEKKRKKKSTQILALIDPDSKNDPILDTIIKTVNESNYDGILVGGSHISDNKFEDRVKKIKNNTNLPIIIFPGDSNQICQTADAILFLSLLSGRNPKYLIEEQVLSSQKIYNYNLEVIPTGYLLLKTDKKSAVEAISKTAPLNMDDVEYQDLISDAKDYFMRVRGLDHYKKEFKKVIEAK